MTTSEAPLKKKADHVLAWAMFCSMNPSLPKGNDRHAKWASEKDAWRSAARSMRRTLGRQGFELTEKNP